MKAKRAMSELLNKERCDECNCAVGDDWEYKDYSNKNIILCPQCKAEYYIES